jgi:O-glycosyl hydrolase
MTFRRDLPFPGKPARGFSGKRRTLLSGLALYPLALPTAKAFKGQLEIDHSLRHQIIEGFGTCINTWHSDVAAAYASDDWADFYLNALGASALRIELWGGIAPLTRQRWQDITWRDFSFQGQGKRGATTVAVAKRLLSRLREPLRVIASTWTPPAWMKANASMGNGHPERKNFALNLDNPIERERWNAPENSSEGRERFTYVGRNKLRPDRYLHFAKYLVEWTRYLRTQGIPLYALSPANEPRFSHWFESCVYGPGEFAELVEVISWMFANQGEPAIPLFGPEHMTWDIAGTGKYLAALAANGTANRSLAAVASHGYIDGYRADLRKESTSAFRKLAEPSGKKVWVTEGGFGEHTWPAPLHQLGAAFLYALRDGNVSLLTAWQTLTRSPPDGHGLMSLLGPTKKTYVAMQFWRFIRPGMIRVSADGNTRLDSVAFEDPASGTTVIVILNRSRHPSPIALMLKRRQRAKIDGLYVTDESRNCARVDGEHDMGLLTIPMESVVTVVLKSEIVPT